MNDEQLERIRELIGMHRQYGHALSPQGEIDLLAEVDRLREENAALTTRLAAVMEKVTEMEAIVDQMR